MDIKPIVILKLRTKIIWNMKEFCNRKEKNVKKNWIKLIRFDLVVGIVRDFSWISMLYIYTEVYVRYVYNKI